MPLSKVGITLFAGLMAFVLSPTTPASAQSDFFSGK
ncbi:MAG: hypothetical protein QOD94_79, partial [Alphaproteobacteria bacterium]|nr:hypothetical protein [Alphaproteobacteria bacterium]